MSGKHTAEKWSPQWRTDLEETVWKDYLEEGVRGPICDKMIPSHVNGKIHKMTVQPTVRAG